MILKIPELCVVALVGPSGAGKSTFARKHFAPTEVLSSDYFRGLVSDDENSLDASRDAFDALYYLARKRLSRSRIVVVDATNVGAEGRRPIVQMAKENDVFAVAIVLKVSEETCHARNATRPDRAFGPHVVRNQIAQLKRSLRGLDDEGFRYVHFVNEAEIDGVTVERVPLYSNRKSERGPFDVVGDVHGCFEELQALLGKLGYSVTLEGERYRVSHPEGRRPVFVGDLVDRGPGILPTLRLVMDAVEDGSAICVPGNHETRLLRHLRGKGKNVTHGLQQTLEQLASTDEPFKARLAKFIDGLVSHYVLDDGRLVVAHAGMKEVYQGRSSGRVREFALYGETSGETDEYGLPVRHNWAAEYRGKAMVVYGHTPVPQAEWLNNTICLDTGCVFGGSLTALRYPERELVSVAALAQYADPIRPLSLPSATSQQIADDLLDFADVSGTRHITLASGRTLTVREENAAAALEVMSRFAADPHWVVYLPPTMSPSETSNSEGFLEHPSEAFSYFERSGVSTVVCEEKHMGSRAVVVVCKDAEAARRRFGVQTGERGIIYTRTGRRFFSDAQLEAQVLERVGNALATSGFWEELSTDWVCLDCELMPWSAKANELLREQYAQVGAAACLSLDTAVQHLGTSVSAEVDALLARTRTRQANAHAFVDSYRRYVWRTEGIEGLKLAPFHVLATEGKVHTSRDHVWHMETIAKICAVDPALLVATPYKVVQLAEPQSVADATKWWLELTAKGGEGMVVKPLMFVAVNDKGLVQPALKTRGQEYLRIIYGPDYTVPTHLERLRKRGVGHKRSMASREFQLGVEGLQRFVAREPLRRVHECVFAVLALESEPVEPRL